jgi:hypothetical protein
MFVIQVAVLLLDALHLLMLFAGTLTYVELKRHPLNMSYKDTLSITEILFVF